MATTQAKANPKKKSSGFQGVRDAIWIIVACFILAVCFFKFVLGNPDNFVGGDPANAVKDGRAKMPFNSSSILVIRAWSASSPLYIKVSKSESARISR